MFTFRFPPEIEDQIFEIAASTGHPHFALALATLSRRIQKRVEPIIYKTLSFASTETYNQYVSGGSLYGPGYAFYEQFEPTLHARPAEFFAANVQNICFTAGVSQSMVAAVLAKCTKVRNLALYSSAVLNAGDVIPPISHSLCFLSTNRLVVHDLAASIAVFPNLCSLHVQIHPEDIPIPVGLGRWLPALSVVRLDLSEEPWVSKQWLEDVKTVTSDQLTSLTLRRVFLYVNEMCLDRVEPEVEAMVDDRIIVRSCEFYGGWDGDWTASDDWEA